jgi:hypothetical protein
MGNRVYRRVEVQGFNADISDGKGFFPGVISNVSRFGIRMSDLPKRVDEKANRMTVVVSGRGKNFKMLVRPKWAELEGSRKIVGFEIINTPFEWTDFVMNLEPKEDRDVWDTINL